MTPEEAIERAIKIMLAFGAGAAPNASIWTAIAAELRAQQTGPALDRLLGQVRTQLPPEDPASRLTLHDVDALMCEEIRIVLRRKAREDEPAPAWWMHADDKTHCVHPLLQRVQNGWERMTYAP